MIIETGKRKLLEQMVEDGVEYIFGNPGTVEQGILDEMSDFPQIKYITCLQESVAVAMADGYARASGQPGVVQLHSGVGLGNGIGMMYQAYRGHTPLIVFAGEAGMRYEAMDAQMACDLVKMAEPVTKYAARAVHEDSVLRLWRRAYKMAMTPPMGPVFLSMPMDVLDKENEEDVSGASVIDWHVSPSRDKISVIAETLAGAANPIILAGDGVSTCNAVGALEKLAEAVCIPVYGVNSSCINISQISPWYRGDLGHMFGSVSRKAVEGADVVLVLGTYLFPEVFPDLRSPFKKDAKVFGIDIDSYEIAKNHPVTLAICCDIKLALEELIRELEVCEVKSGRGRAEQAGAFVQRDLSPAASEFMATLKGMADDDLIIFDEALTFSPCLTYYLPRAKPGTYFQTRGGSLGVGIPGGMGVLLAKPGSRVIVFTGDGGSMYTIQALAAARRYHIPVGVVICNNGKYGLLEQNLDVYRKEHGMGKKPQPDCFSLKPEVDYVGLAKSMGVEGIRVEKVAQVRDAVERLLCGDEAFLVEI